MSFAEERTSAADMRHSISTPQVHDESGVLAPAPAARSPRGRAASASLQSQDAKPLVSLPRRGHSRILEGRKRTSSVSQQSPRGAHTSSGFHRRFSSQHDPVRKSSLKAPMECRSPVGPRTGTVDRDMVAEFYAGGARPTESWFENDQVWKAFILRRTSKLRRGESTKGESSRVAQARGTQDESPLDGHARDERSREELARAEQARAELALASAVPPTASASTHAASRPPSTTPQPLEQAPKSTSFSSDGHTDTSPFRWDASDTTRPPLPSSPPALPSDTHAISARTLDLDLDPDYGASTSLDLEFSRGSSLSAGPSAAASAGPSPNLSTRPSPSLSARPSPNPSTGPSSNLRGPGTNLSDTFDFVFDRFSISSLQSHTDTSSQRDDSPRRRPDSPRRRPARTLRTESAERTAVDTTQAFYQPRVGQVLANFNTPSVQSRSSTPSRSTPSLSSLSTPSYNGPLSQGSTPSHASPSYSRHHEPLGLNVLRQSTRPTEQWVRHGPVEHLAHTSPPDESVLGTFQESPEPFDAAPAQSASPTSRRDRSTTDAVLPQSPTNTVSPPQSPTNTTFPPQSPTNSTFSPQSPRRRPSDSGSTVFNPVRSSSLGAIRQHTASSATAPPLLPLLDATLMMNLQDVAVDSASDASGPARIDSGAREIAVIGTDSSASEFAQHFQRTRSPTPARSATPARSSTPIRSSTPVRSATPGRSSTPHSPTPQSPTLRSAAPRSPTMRTRLRSPPARAPDVRSPASSVEAATPAWTDTLWMLHRGTGATVSGSAKLSPFIKDVPAAVRRRLVKQPKERGGKADPSDSPSVLSVEHPLTNGSTFFPTSGASLAKSTSKLSASASMSSSLSAYRESRGRHSYEWREVIASVSRDGVFTVSGADGEDDVYSIALPDCLRTDIRPVDRSAFDKSMCVIISAGANTAYFRFKDIVSFQTWMVIAMCLTEPELPIDPRSSLFGLSASRKDGGAASGDVFTEATTIEKSALFRVKRTLTLTINEGRGVGELTKSPHSVAMHDARTNSGYAGSSGGTANMRGPSEPASSISFSPVGSLNDDSFMSLNHESGLKISSSLPVSSSMQKNETSRTTPDSSFMKLSAKARSAVPSPGNSSVGNDTALNNLDTFCQIVLDGHVVAKTNVRKGTASPFWSDTFTFENLPPFSDVNINVYDAKSGKPSLIGCCAIPLRELARGAPVGDWYPLRPLAPAAYDNAGELSVTVLLQEDVILPGTYYKRLLKLLKQDESAELVCDLAGDLPNRLEELAQALLNIYQVEGSLVERIKRMIDSEIEPENLPASILFRGNTIVTKSIELYIRMIGSAYLESSIGDPVRQICAEKNDDIEIDPSRMRGVREKDLVANAAALRAKAALVWNSIYAAREKCPHEMRVLFAHIQRVVTDKYGPDEEHRNIRFTAVSAFIFLRFFVPAILNPTLFGLLHGQPDARAQRTLTLVAKTLQGLANFATFGQKEPWMRPMNSFVDEHASAFVDFIAHIASPAPVAHVEWTSPLFRAYRRPAQIRAALRPSVVREGVPRLPHMVDIYHNLALVADFVCGSGAAATPRRRFDSPAAASHRISRSRHYPEFLAQCNEVHRETRRRAERGMCPDEFRRWRATPLQRLPSQQNRTRSIVSSPTRVRRGGEELIEITVARAELARAEAARAEAAKAEASRAEVTRLERGRFSLDQDRPSGAGRNMELTQNTELSFHDTPIAVRRDSFGLRDVSAKRGALEKRDSDIGRDSLATRDVLAKRDSVGSEPSVPFTYEPRESMDSRSFSAKNSATPRASLESGMLTRTSLDTRPADMYASMETRTSFETPPIDLWERTDAASTHRGVGVRASVADFAASITSSSPKQSPGVGAVHTTSTGPVSFNATPPLATAGAPRGSTTATRSSSVHGHLNTAPPLVGRAVSVSYATDAPSPKKRLNSPRLLSKKSRQILNERDTSTTTDENISTDDAEPHSRGLLAFSHRFASAPRFPSRSRDDEHRRVNRDLDDLLNIENDMALSGNESSGSSRPRPATAPSAALVSPVESSFSADTTPSLYIVPNAHESDKRATVAGPTPTTTTAITETPTGKKSLLRRMGF